MSRDVLIKTTAGDALTFHRMTGVEELGRPFEYRVELRTQDEKWQLAFIGKNLTDKQAFRSAGDVPETGGNTGTDEGFRGDYSGGVIRPRQYELELRFQF